MNQELIINVLKKVIADLTDGSATWYDIQENTGLPEERCKEISKIAQQCIKEVGQG